MNDIDDFPPSESSPLLNRRQNELAQAEVRLPIRSSRYKLTSATGIVCLLIFSTFCSAMSVALCIAPVAAMFEDAICRRHYAGREEENDCKTGEVQSQVAWFQVFLSIVWAVTSIIVVLPYGAMSDRIGRRPIFLFATMGATLSLFWTIIMLQLYDRIPFHLVFLSPILQVLGGGPPTLGIIRLSIAADLVSPSKRATSLLYIAAAGYLGNWAGIAFADYMLRWGSVLMPVMVAFVLIPIGSSTIIFIPETLHTVTDQPAPADNAQGRQHFSKARFRSCIRLQGFKMPSWSMIMVLSCCSLATPEDIGMEYFLVHYLHDQLGSTPFAGVYFQGMHVLTTVLLFALILPLILATLQSETVGLRLSATRIDLTLAQASALMLMVGSFLMGTSISALVVTGFGIYALGRGFIWLCYSVLLSFTKQHASLFALAYMVQTTVAVASGPVLLDLVLRAIDSEGKLQGLLYIVLGGCFVVALVLLLLVRVPVSSVHEYEPEAAPSGTRPNLASRIYRQISLIVARR